MTRPRKPKVKCTDWEKEYGQLLIATGIEIENVRRQRNERMAEVASLTEQLKAKDARVAELEQGQNVSEQALRGAQERIDGRDRMYDEVLDERWQLSLFMRDCQLVLATAPCTLCGAKWINAGGLQEAFKRYADRTAIPPKGTK